MRRVTPKPSAKDTICLCVVWAKRLPNDKLIGEWYGPSEAVAMHRAVDGLEKLGEVRPLASLVFDIRREPVGYLDLTLEDVA